jgi:hypothetical protein
MENTTVDTEKALKPEEGIVIQNIIIRPVQRITQDIQKWRSAMQTAEGVTQYRTTLYDMYSDVYFRQRVKYADGKTHTECYKKQTGF